MEKLKNTVQDGVHDGVQDAHELLAQVQMWDELVNAKIAERDELLDLATKITPDADGMPHGQDVSDKVGNVAVKLVDLAREIDALVDMYINRKAEIISLLEKLPPTEYGVLHRYYIKYMTLGEIARDMHYSYCQVWRIKEKGLQHLKDAIE